MDNLTIFDTRDMSIDEINHELSNRMRFLEDLGMERIDSCGFVSSIMNLGIASQEKAMKFTCCIMRRTQEKRSEYNT